MLTDLAARKLNSESPCTSPKHSGFDTTDGELYVDTGELTYIFCNLITGFVGV